MYGFVEVIRIIIGTCAILFIDRFHWCSTASAVKLKELRSGGICCCEQSATNRRLAIVKPGQLARRSATVDKTPLSMRFYAKEKLLEAAPFQFRG